jgi:predicted nucleotide-binding protein
MTNEPINPASRQITKLLISQEEAQKLLQDRIEKGHQIRRIQITSKETLKYANNEYNKWDSYNTELLKKIFNTNERSQSYSLFSKILIPDTIIKAAVYFQENIDRKIHRLDLIVNMLDLTPVAESNPPITLTNMEKFKKIFVVHGHDSEAKIELARTIEKLKLIAVILHEQPNEGKTIIEKFERDASQVSFAVVLLTPDDIGYPKSNPDSMKPRARQNVILELGFFTGALGRSNVCVLYKGDVEIPSDYMGVTYIPMDDGGAWRFALGKELRQANLTVDLNDLS